MAVATSDPADGVEGYQLKAIRRDDLWGLRVCYPLAKLQGGGLIWQKHEIPLKFSLPQVT